MQDELLVGLGEGPSPDHYTLCPVVGVKAGEESVMVVGKPSDGQVARFFVRDPPLAVEELERLMTDYKRKQLTAAMSGAARGPAAAGLLLFSCAGRGRDFFGQPKLESQLAQLTTGVPLGGCFGNGEIGPADVDASGERRTVLHSFTSIFALLGSKH